MRYDLLIDSEKAFQLLGDYAKSIRIAKGYSRDDVVAITKNKFSKSWLQKFENHRYLQHSKNFDTQKVKDYLEFLGINNPFTVTLEVNKENFIKHHEDLAKEKIK